VKGDLHCYIGLSILRLAVSEIGRMICEDRFQIYLHQLRTPCKNRGGTKKSVVIVSKISPDSAEIGDLQRKARHRIKQIETSSTVRPLNFSSCELSFQYRETRRDILRCG